MDDDIDLKEIGYTLDSPKCGNCVFFTSKKMKYTRYESGHGGMLPVADCTKDIDMFCVKHKAATRKTAYCDMYERKS